MFSITWNIFLILLISNNCEIFAITNRRHAYQDISVRTFRHIGTSTNFKTDWEPGLREATTLSLYREHNTDPNLRKLLQNAPLLGKQDKASPFGDIAVLARGQLYANFGGYVFVQDPYQNDCEDCHNINRRCDRINCEIWKPRNNEQLLALWTIKRIRHRDFHGNHRYEIEYTISPINLAVNQPFVTKDGHFDYAIPGHVFVLRTDNLNIPQNHNSFDYKPGTLIINGNKQYTGGFRPTTTTIKSTTSDADLYKTLLDLLKKKTSTVSTNSIETTKNPTTTTIGVEIPKTTPLEQKTSQLVPNTDTTTSVIRTEGTTNNLVSVDFPTTSGTTQTSTTSMPKTIRTTTKPKATFHYFSADEEKTSESTESVSTTKISTQASTPKTTTRQTYTVPSTTPITTKTPRTSKITKVPKPTFTRKVTKPFTTKKWTTKIKQTTKKSSPKATTQYPILLTDTTQIFTTKVPPPTTMREESTTTQFITSNSATTTTEEYTRPNDITLSTINIMKETELTPTQNFNTTDTFITTVGTTPVTTSSTTIEMFESTSNTTIADSSTIFSGTVTSSLGDTTLTYSNSVFEPMSTTESIKTTFKEPKTSTDSSKTTTTIKSDFLDEENNENPKKNTQLVQSNYDFKDDDIFGTTLSVPTTPMSVIATTERKKTDVEIELFGEESTKSNNRKAKSRMFETTISPTVKIIYSNFYTPSTLPVTTYTPTTVPPTQSGLNELETTKKEPHLTSQSYSTSISIEINKNNLENSEELNKERLDKNTSDSGNLQTIQTTDNGTMLEKIGDKNVTTRLKTSTLDDDSLQTSFNNLAMMVLNHARSINYLEKTTKAGVRYKKRKAYVPRRKRPTKKSSQSVKL